MTIVTDVLTSLGLGLAFSFILTFDHLLVALRPSLAEIKRSERAAAILARSNTLRRDGYFYLVPGLILVGLRSLPGGILETLGWALVICGYAMLVGSIIKLFQWRYPSVRRGG